MSSSINITVNKDTVYAVVEATNVEKKGKYRLPG